MATQRPTRYILVRLLRSNSHSCQALDVLTLLVPCYWLSESIIHQDSTWWSHQCKAISRTWFKFAKSLIQWLTLISWLSTWTANMDCDSPYCADCLSRFGRPLVFFGGVVWLRFRLWTTRQAYPGNRGESIRSAHCLDWKLSSPSRALDCGARFSQTLSALSLQIRVSDGVR
jgi:hypothetical protein